MSYLKFKVLNEKGQKIAPSFSVPIILEHDILFFPTLFNFSLPEEGYLVAKNPLIDSCKTFDLSHNDAYLTSFSINNIPTYLQIQSFVLKIGNKIKIKAKINNQVVPIPAGDHTINSQSLFLKPLKFDKHNFNKHIFQQIICDCNYYQILGTQFSVGAKITKFSNMVILKTDPFEFTTLNQFGGNDFVGAPVFNTGGYLLTAANTLAEELRPAQTQTLVGYDQNLSINVSIDTFGSLKVAAGNYFNQTLPLATYSIPELCFVWYLEPEIYDQKWIQQYTIQQEFNNLSSSLYPLLRDSHTNCFYNNVIATAWCSAVEQPYPEVNPYMNIFFAKYEVVDGKIKEVIKAKRLTNYFVSTSPITVIPGAPIFDTAIIINPKDQKNVVISYGLITLPIDTYPNFNLSGYVLVSKDGGDTFTDPIQVFSQYAPYDCRGIIVDENGNILFCANFANNYTIDDENFTANLQFWNSTNGGLSWTKIFNTNFVGPSDSQNGYDYPQVFTGKLGNRYGLICHANFYPVSYEADNHAHIIFIPIEGLGKLGPVEVIEQEKYLNLLTGSQPTVSKKGELFLTGYWGENDFYVNFWAGILGLGDTEKLTSKTVNKVRTLTNISNNNGICASIPENNYFSQSVQGNFYDDSRGAFYSLYAEQINENSNDYFLFLLITLDKGITVSGRIKVAKSSRNNRGFCTLWFDKISKALAFCWYDGEKDPLMQGTQYTLGYMSSEKLNLLVGRLRKKYIC